MFRGLYCLGLTVHVYYLLKDKYTLKLCKNPPCQHHFFKCNKGVRKQRTVGDVALCSIDSNVELSPLKRPDPCCLSRLTLLFVGLKYLVELWIKHSYQRAHVLW